MYSHCRLKKYNLEKRRLWDDDGLKKQRRNFCMKFIFDKDIEEELQTIIKRLFEN